MNARIRSALPLAALLGALAVCPVRADDASFSVDRFRFAPSSTDVLVLAGAEVPSHFTYGAALGMDWARSLLIIERSGAKFDLVGSGFAAQLSGTVAFGGRYEVGAVLPFVLTRSTASGGLLPAASGAGLEDLVVVPKVALPSWRETRFAASMPLTLPIGRKHALLGEGGVTAAPTAIAERDVGPVRVVANLGLALRPARTYYDLKVGSAILYGVAGEIPFEAGGWGWAALGNVWGEVGLVDSGTGVRPAELDVALRWDGPRGLSATFGLGTGLIAGYGAPASRVFAMAGWRPRGQAAAAPAAAPAPPPAPPPEPAPEPAPAPPAVEPAPPPEPPPPPPIARDPCAFGEKHAPEECPDLDDDGDGIPNRLDKCPLVPGVAAFQGCKPPDPCEPGQKHAPEQCPEADDDGDGILNKVDRCPLVPGLTEHGGCPDPCAPGQKHEPEQCPLLDDDGDGIPNGEDRCPLVKGLPEFKGCPPPKAVLTAKKIELKEAVYFDSGKASILERSFQLLDDISRILVDNPQVKLVSIEGHTDSTGTAAENLTLSQQRADAVKTFLVRKGVGAERLASKGFGQERPVADNKTDAGRARNRRVEFLVKGE
jgi:outer membrane protein OmpA-like peptidoglycan-associated protein